MTPVLEGKHKMNKSLAILGCLLFIINSEQSFSQQRVENGIFDLRDMGLREKQIFELNGEWEFYWNKHHHPSAFNRGIPEEGILGSVPSYWTNYSDQIPEITPKGKA